MNGEADPRGSDPALPWGRPGAERVPPSAGRASLHARDPAAATVLRPKTHFYRSSTWKDGPYMYIRPTTDYAHLLHPSIPTAEPRFSLCWIHIGTLQTFRR
jgi:hypothetical protein